MNLQMIWGLQLIKGEVVGEAGVTSDFTLEATDQFKGITGRGKFVDVPIEERVETITSINPTQVNLNRDQLLREGYPKEAVDAFIPPKFIERVGSFLSGLIQ